MRAAAAAAERGRFGKARKLRAQAKIHALNLENAMTLCPIAIVSGCAKCPIYKPCPLKGVIGDYKPEEKKAEKSASSKK